MRADIYNLERGMITAVNRLSDIHPQDREDLLKFKNELIAQNISIPRVIKYLVNLRAVSKMASKPFREYTTDYTKEIAVKINSVKSWSDYTKHDHRVLLKRFFKWLFGNDETYPDQVKWIKSTMKKKSEVLPEELVSREEAELIANATTNPRDKAFVLMLFESGCRVGELLTLQMKNVKYDAIGMIIQVTGKTGSRRVRILKYVKEMTAWLDVHPNKNDQESNVWIKSNGEVVGYNAAAKVLKEAAKKANINKRIHCHGFRHSRASELASLGLGEANMKEYLGWVQGSDMASTYIHLSGRNIDDALLRVNGIKLDDKTELKKVSIRRCPKCEANNNILSHFCVSCSYPMDMKYAIELDEQRQQLDDFVRDFIMELAKQDKRVGVIFRKMVGERKLEHLFEDDNNDK